MSVADDPPLPPPPPPAEPVPRPGPRGGMTLLEHLAELRNVVISAAAAVVVASGGCWFFSVQLLEVLTRPMREAGQRVFFLAPTEAFMMRLKVAFFCGLLIVLPYVLARIYGFVVPGLYRRERRVVTPLLVSSVALFYGGVAFAFFLLVPQVVRILLGFGTDMVQPLIGVGAYISFVAQLCFAFGLVFELPLVVLFLSWLGIVKPRTLLRTWRIAVVIIFVASGILTPGPDPVSQLVMAIPVTVLYISSAFISLAVTRRRRTAGGGADGD